jgi:hypothetical protein
MIKRYKWMLFLPVLCFCWAIAGAEASAANESAEIELLEFLGSLPEDTDEWDDFVEVAGAGIPPTMAEVDHAD